MRAIVIVSLPVFYRKTIVLNKKILSTKGPLFLLTNHPCTVMDPFNVVGRSNRIVFFLANASLFKHPLANWILRNLYCIRVERYEDVSDRPVKNESAFAQSINFLQNGGCLYVAPEGTSEVARRIRKVKTGTARIALAAEAANDFQLGTQILPVGLIYSDPRFFRETLIVSPSSLIQVSDYKELFLKDEWLAVEALTDAIHAGLSANIIDTETDEQDETLRGLELISQTENPLPLAPRTRRTQQQLEKIRDGLLSDALQNRLRNYFQELSQHRFSDESLAGKWRYLPQLILFLLGLPIALFGLVNHLLPCGIPWLVNKKLNVWACYDATYRYVSGLIFFPLFYYLQIRFSTLFMDWWIYAILLVLSGLFVDYYLRKFGSWMQGLRWSRFSKKYPEKANFLELERKEILQALANSALLKP